MGSSTFADRRVIVVGLGASGRAAASVLSDEGARVVVSERRPLDEVEGAVDLEARGVELHGGGHLPEHLDGVDLVLASPGVPEGTPILASARERGLPIWSELELGARFCRVPIVAVTGTNGKTTTTEMVAAAMTASGLDAVACGNIGHPFSLAAREDHDALAVEASSFQLRFIETFHPKVSVLVNLADDHLDWHGSFRSYANAKGKVFERQGEGDTHVGNADDPAGAALSSSAPCPTVWFRLGSPGPGEVGYEDGELVSRLGDRALSLGRPAGVARGFLADAAAASAAALSFGLDAGAAGAGITSVGPLPHRGWVVARVGPVAFVDDSKATNPHAALAALEGLRDVVLVAGGLAKGVDLSPLRTATGRLKGVVVIGDAAAEIAALFESAVPVRKAGSIEEAARAAWELAPPGGTVLLAPACASQDMFRDYKERGDRFAAAAAALERDGSEG